MPDYQVAANGTRDFVLAANGQTLGTLHYTEWFSFKAVLTLADGAAFQIEPKGFWGTTIEVKDEQAVLLNFKMNWGGNILIKSKLTSRAFLFKQKSLLKSTFVLLDKEERELLLVQPSFKWSSFNHDYSLTSTPEFEMLDSKALLLLTTIHCANYYMTMVAAAVVVAS